MKQQEPITDAEVAAVANACFHGAYAGKRTMLWRGANVSIPDLYPDPTQMPDPARVRAELERISYGDEG